MLRWNKLIVCGLLIVASGVSLWTYKLATHSKSSLPASQVNSVQADVSVEAPIQFEKTVSREKISALVAKQPALGEVAKEFYATLPASLSEVPGPAHLRVDEDGNLIIEKRVQSLFEYYLTATGEEPLENIVARIKHDLESQLNPLAAAQAVALLEGYLQYRNNIGAIKNDYAAQLAGRTVDLALIKEMKQAVRESRSEFLPQEATDSFYSGEDDYDDYMMKRVQIVSNSSLSQEDKRAELALLDMSSPSQMVESRAQVRQISNVRSSVEILRKAGASSEEIYSLREQEFGAEAAQRLDVLDSKRQLWDTRVADYRSQLDALDLDTDYPPAEREQLVDTLRSQYFDPQEVLRVRALDQIQDNSIEVE